MLRFFAAALALVLLLASCQSRGSGDSSKPEAAPELSSRSLSSKAASGPESGADPDLPLTFRLTIPEGYTLPRIGMELEEMGLCTAEEFIAAAQNGDFGDFPLVAAQDGGKNRCFSLEGYLFPDTYEFYSDVSPEVIITAILAHAEKMITQDLRDEITKSGYSADEIITMASIIEKEAFGPEEMANISSVLHNRLNIGMKLQCDVTIHYVENALKPFITGDTDRFSADYNTYKCDGLPAGAICNPGINAINAALNPADTPYLFFVTDSDKKYYFAESWEEHQRNVAVAMP